MLGQADFDSDGERYDMISLFFLIIKCCAFYQFMTVYCIHIRVISGVQMKTV